MNDKQNDELADTLDGIQIKIEYSDRVNFAMQ